MVDEKPLEHLQNQQRIELDYRRRRESDVFTWSNSILLAAIGGLLVVGKSESAIIGTVVGKVLATATVSILVLMSIKWQNYHAGAANAAQRILARIGRELGAAGGSHGKGDSWQDDVWRRWEEPDRGLIFRFLRPSRIQATLLLGTIAGALIWLR